ncbi:MAG: hypothetical protein Q7R43_06815, partial [Candidatus Daviesbacteria bacterium]|nr:hypothetical protein [Candidatus Daviesbacteria bacterium]
NTKHKRIGHLFQGTFKAVPIETDMQFIHVSRYIHLNPYTSEITDNLEDYRYSSYPHYIGLVKDKLCNSEIILGSFKDIDDYKEFVAGNADYGRELEHFKHSLLDPED